MHKRKVRAILGLGVIIVIICGVAFFFVRGKDTVPVEEPVKQESIFINENTVTDPAQLEVEEEFKWLDVDLDTEDDMLVSRDTVLRTEPRDTATKVADLAVDEWVKRDAYCTDMKGVELQWDRVTYNGKTGYVKSVDVDIMIANDGMEDDKVPPTASGVSEKSIVEVSEPVEEVEEEPAEEVAEAEPTPEVQEETPKAEEPAPSTEPTPAPQAPTTNGGVTPEGQALLEQILADGGTMIEDVPVVDQQPGEGGHSGLVWQ